MTLKMLMCLLRKNLNKSNEGKKATLCSTCENDIAIDKEQKRKDLHQTVRLDVLLKT